MWGADYVYTPRIRGGGVIADPAGGRVRQIEPAELVGVVPDVFDRARRRRAGQVDRSADLVGATARPGRLFENRSARGRTGSSTRDRTAWTASSRGG